MFDTETTGLDSNVEALTEIGAVYVENGKINPDKSFCTFVNPGKPIDQLEVGVVLVDLVSGKHGFRVALAHAVVGNGNGAVAHAVGQAHDLAGIAEAVHACH